MTESEWRHQLEHEEAKRQMRYPLPLQVYPMIVFVIEEMNMSL